MHNLVLLRHGQSTWNLENRFTGWIDVPLTDHGIQEAVQAGKKLKENGFIFDIAHTNYLKRAIKTTWLTLEEMDLMWIPIYKTWRLNERHYGALQGLNKSEMAVKYGEEQVKFWRRSYNILPPELDINDERYPGKDPRYQSLSPSELPRAESLELTLNRALPYWLETIAPQIKTGQRLLISASHNSLRALVKHLSNLSPEEIVEFNIPTGIPLIYELDDQLQPTKRYYLASDEELNRAVEEVKNQGKAK